MPFSACPKRTPPALAVGATDPAMSRIPQTIDSSTVHALGEQGLLHRGSWYGPCGLHPNSQCVARIRIVRSGAREALWLVRTGRPRFVDDLRALCGVGGGTRHATALAKRAALTRQGVIAYTGRTYESPRFAGDSGCNRRRQHPHARAPVDARRSFGACSLGAGERRQAAAFCRGWAAASIRGHSSVEQPTSRVLDGESAKQCRVRAACGEYRSDLAQPGSTDAHRSLSVKENRSLRVHRVGTQDRAADGRSHGELPF